MALIHCPECNRQISSSAATCPGCGIPVAAAADTLATGSPLTTIQETSKRFKVHILGAWCLFIIGWVMIFSTIKDIKAGDEPTPWPGLVVFAGFAWWVVTKFRIWWHHR
jgi:hypothetical protein